jgi:hypothetical protein
MNLNKIRVIIAGGRDFNDYDLLERKCDLLLFNHASMNIEIVSGAAKGADYEGEMYARKKGLKLKKFPADWDKYGKSAGYKRNQQMADYATHLIAFWDGTSRGTKNMIDIATQQKLKVRVIKY